MEKLSNLELAVDTLPSRRQRRRSSRTAKVVCVLLVSSLMIGGVYAGLLTYFGQVHVTMTTHQSIVVGDQYGNWYEGDNNPVGREVGDVSHCTDYCYKLLLKNQGCEAADVWFTEIPCGDTDLTGVTISHHVFGDTQTVHLLQKEVVFGQSPWLPLVDGAYADVTFNTCGPIFNYEISYSGLEKGVEYSLIYYANLPEYWTEGPVIVLGSFTEDGTGTTSGSADVPTMPISDDENALRPISDLGETYDHQYGAKIWIVPTEALTAEDDVDWGMAASFLFETDLIFYLDCDAWISPDLYCLPNVYPLFDTEIDDSGKFLLQAESCYCWITCYHLDFYIESEHIAFNTFVNGAPHMEA